jgi:hypothetical protein
MINKVIFSQQIIWCPSNDRHIIIFKENDAIVGLNYCQGDDVEALLTDYSGIDHNLTDFYNVIKNFLGKGDEIDIVNEVIWAHHNYKQAEYDRKYCQRCH